MGERASGCPHNVRRNFSDIHRPDALSGDLAVKGRARRDSRAKRKQDRQGPFKRTGYLGMGVAEAEGWTTYYETTISHTHRSGWRKIG